MDKENSEKPDDQIAETGNPEVGELEEEFLKEKNTMGYYIPLRMWIVMVFFFGLIAAMWDQLYMRFLATPELNTVIISTIAIVIGLNITNILKFQRSSKFINDLAELEVSGRTKEYRDYLEILKKKNYVVDCFTMRQSLESAAEKPPFTPLTITDKESMMIKSKVGKRANVMRANVTYLSGVLVMLGLIGTFWGMLDTLNSVGEAMAGLSQSVSGEGGLGDFINGISKPLEGMGIAFSSSLFGLVGSLVGGLMNNFCSKGMDAFIEDFGFWLDSHIDKPGSFVSMQKTAVAQGFSGEGEGGKDEKSPGGFGALRGLSDQMAEMLKIMKQQAGMPMGGVGGGDAGHLSQVYSKQQNIVKSFEEYSNVQGQLLDKFIEHTSTQFYASNAFKQSLDTLNTTQSKNLQVMFDQKVTSERMAREVQSLRHMIYAISKGEEVEEPMSDDVFADKLRQSLDEKLAWMSSDDDKENPEKAEKTQDQKKASGE